MTLKIEYSHDDREAIISSEVTDQSWTAISRACQDSAGLYFKTISSNKISMPWWAFLNARKAIAYQATRHNLKVIFSQDAESLLKQALERSKAYNEAVAAKFLEKNDVFHKLSDAGFSRKLTDRQLENVRKISAFPASATFSVPGAGKTSEALAFFCCRKKKDTKLMVVCPKNAFAAWEEQIEAIFPDQNIKVRRLTGGYSNIKNILTGNHSVSLITYHQFAIVEDILAEYVSSHDTFIFLDESHKIKKGNDGKIGRSILSLAHLPSAKCIMSGTPLPNSIADLIPQFTFLYPEVPVDEENVKALIKPLYVRTTKSQLNIPAVTRKLVPISLLPAQRALYRLLCSEFVRESHIGLSAIDRRQLRYLGKSAIRLLQLVSNPALLLEKKISLEKQEILSDVLSEGDSPKLQYVMKRARQLSREGKKTIIWSGFVDNVELIAERLFDLGADYIHGGVEAGSEEEEDTRERKIKKFHDDKNSFVLVANPAACSEGISLHTVCHNAIYMDRNYNAAQYLQSEDRIHRFGLPKNQETLVEIVYCPETVDETVHDRLAKKIKIMGEVLDDPDLNIDPIPFDADGFGFDEEDANTFFSHIKAEATQA